MQPSKNHSTPARNGVAPGIFDTFSLPWLALLRAWIAVTLRGYSRVVRSLSTHLLLRRFARSSQAMQCRCEYMEAAVENKDQTE